MGTRRALAVVIAVGALSSASLGVSLARSGTSAANISQSGKVAAALVEATANGPAPSTTVYDQ